MLLYKSEERAAVRRIQIRSASIKQRGKLGQSALFSAHHSVHLRLLTEITKTADWMMRTHWN